MKAPGNSFQAATVPTADFEHIQLAEQRAELFKKTRFAADHGIALQNGTPLEYTEDKLMLSTKIIWRASQAFPFGSLEQPRD